MVNRLNGKNVDKSKFLCVSSSLFLNFWAHTQTYTDDAVKVLHSMCQQIWKTQQWPQDWKRSNTTERQCQRMFKLLHHRAHLTC